MEQPAPSPSQTEENLPSEQDASIAKIQTLLKAKDDTSRFVGLALLKSVLDNSQSVREDENFIVTLWESIPSKFLDRLIRTGSRRDMSMLDLAVSVLHIFSSLLPETARKGDRLVGRIPQLVSCLLQCPDKTAQPVLETLLSAVSLPEGAQVFVSIEDLTPMTEMAPSQPLVLDILLHAWLNVVSGPSYKTNLRVTIDKTIGNLVASFKGTDAVTLLDFLAKLLPRLESETIPPNPAWIPSLGKFIFNLVVSRPTAASRAAFTNLSAALLESYPLQTPPLLFANESSSDDKPVSYLLVNLMLVDLRSSLPLLLEQLNSPQYPQTAWRLASAFNVVSNYIGYLLRSMDSPNPSFVVSPDLLLKLRRSLSETMSVAVEFLRDRYDASVAGALGLHPEARTGTANTAAGVHLTLAWDSKDIGATISNDPLVLAAVQALAIWLREDDNEMLRKEAAGLVDMLMDLYRRSATPVESLNFQRPVLVALEGITAEKKGIEAFINNDGWQVLADDMMAILHGSRDEGEAAKGVEVVRVLLHVAEAERPGPREQWMDVVTRVAAWYYVAPEDAPVGMVEEFQVAALQLVTALLSGTHPGVRKRYVHSTSAVLGVAVSLKKSIVSRKGEKGLVEGLEDVLVTLGEFR